MKLIQIEDDGGYMHLIPESSILEIGFGYNTAVTVKLINGESFKTELPFKDDIDPGLTITQGQILKEITDQFHQK